MQIVLLAGGMGSRLAEETEIKPKPMVEVGGSPILWHIMKGYSHFGFNEFVIALGYKGEVIKRYFLDYALSRSNFSVRTGSGDTLRHDLCGEDWTVHLVDTGLSTNTGGRLKRLSSRLQGGTFMMTYGDGVSNVNIRELLAFHRRHGKLATVTAVHPTARFGELVLADDGSDPQVIAFTEKPQVREGWINGGFFVLEPEVLDYIDDDQTSWQAEPMERLAREGQLMAFRHEGFWQCMDTLRDMYLLESLWNREQAPWRVWDLPTEIPGDRIVRSA
jgi:glucose-1-phosphate cytidylyltransferase